MSSELNNRREFLKLGVLAAAGGVLALAEAGCQRRLPYNPENRIDFSIKSGGIAELPTYFADAVQIDRARVTLKGLNGSGAFYHQGNDLATGPYQRVIFESAGNEFADYKIYDNKSRFRLDSAWPTWSWGVAIDNKLPEGFFQGALTVWRVDTNPQYNSEGPRDRYLGVRPSFGEDGVRLEQAWPFERSAFRRPSAGSEELTVKLGTERGNAVAYIWEEWPVRTNPLGTNWEKHDGS